MQKVNKYDTIKFRKGGDEMGAVYSVIIALIFNAIDIISGVISAVKNKSLESSKLRDGLFKKIGFIICYLISWLIDTQGYRIGFNLGVDVLPIIILYVCTTELVSIIENVCNINPDILPEKLLEIFKLKKE